MGIRLQFVVDRFPFTVRFSSLPGLRRTTDLNFVGKSQTDGLRFGTDQRWLLVQGRTTTIIRIIGVVDRVHILVHTMSMNRITVSLPDEVYYPLVNEIGKGNISRFVAEGVGLLLTKKRLANNLDEVLDKIDKTRREIGKIELSDEELKKLMRKGLV